MIARARRRKVSRRELARSARFADLSPGVGQLDDDAVTAALGDDADEALSLLADMTHAVDEQLRARARRLAARLFVDLAVGGNHRILGTRRLALVPYRPDAGDLDIDASLDAVLEARAALRAVDPDGLAVRGWTTPRTVWCLLVDRSGSMGGRPLATAGMAAAAMTIRARPGDLAVLCFGRRVVTATSLGEPRPTEDVIDRVLALRGTGTTDVAGALRAAAAQLASSPAGRRVTVLLSDCRATEPGDVEGAARAVEELVILAPAAESEAAEELADAAGARLATITGPASVPAALERVLPR